MYVLHWERMSGAIAPQALMDEMGVAYRKVPVDMAAQAHKSAAYRSLCPTMRVPALETPQGEVLGESGAIVLLLGERYPESEMVPAPGDPDRARFLFWLFYMASVGYPTFSRAWHPEQFTLESAAEASIKAVAESDLDKDLRHPRRRLTRNAVLSRARVLGARHLSDHAFTLVA